MKEKCITAEEIRKKKRKGGKRARNKEKQIKEATQSRTTNSLAVFLTLGARRHCYNNVVRAGIGTAPQALINYNRASEARISRRQTWLHIRIPQQEIPNLR